MQKTFIKYTFLIVTAAIFLILSINFVLTLHALESQKYDSFQIKIDQVIHTMENNQQELSALNENLDEDYLTRAKAAAYVLDRQKEVSMDVKEMQYLAKLLNVDEVHVIDENGIIVLASVSKYIGIDMDDHAQTRPFLDLMESEEEDPYLIQEAQPNAAENKIMKYVGVARKGKKGVVQVGFEPVRQLEAEARNTYEYIFSKFPTDMGEELFAVGKYSGKVLGHSAGMDMEFTASHYQLEELEDCGKGKYQWGKNGKLAYVVSKNYEDVLICAALPGEVIFRDLLENILHTFLYLVIVEAAVILLLNYLVKRKVVNGIHDIIADLSSITDGNLDTEVSVGGNLEFEQLGHGINVMVKKLQYENTHDHLTGLYKFPRFKELAGERLKNMQPERVCAMVMIDLDSFKEINDNYGHDAGDRYLKSFAEVMMSMPAEHFITARRSGDEFCMMIHGCTDNSEIPKYLDAFYQALGSHPVALSDQETRVISASGGYAWTGDAGAEISELLNCADQALYDMKRERKGGYAEFSGHKQMA